MGGPIKLGRGDGVAALDAVGGRYGYEALKKRAARRSSVITRTERCACSRVWAVV
jgi:hypothetical protein